MPVASLVITNTASVATTTPGSVVRFTATFTNTGQTPYTGITISSNITDVLDDATPNGDQTATSGTLTLTSTGISWTGDIPVGGTVTVTGHRHGEQSRCREQGDGQHADHGGAGQQLPGRRRRPAVHGHGRAC